MIGQRGVGGPANVIIFITQQKVFKTMNCYSNNTNQYNPARCCEPFTKSSSVSLRSIFLNDFMGTHKIIVTH